MIDEAAERLGIDPFEIRLRNALHPGDKTMTGEAVRESVGIAQTIRACEKKAEPIIACYRKLYAEKNDPAREVRMTAAVFSPSCRTASLKWIFPAPTWDRASAPA